MDMHPIPMDEAEKRFQVSEHLYGAPGFSKMMLVSGDTKLDALNLHDLLDDDCYGYIFDGNLEVQGEIISRDEEVMSLLVTGDLRCRSIHAGGADTAILGNLVCESHLIGIYNHGYVHVSGDITSPYVLNSDHDIACGGSLAGVNIDLFSRAGRNQLAPELLDNDEGVDLDRLLEWVEAGRPIVAR